MYKSNRNEERVFPTDFADSQKAKPNVEGHDLKNITK